MSMRRTLDHQATGQAFQVEYRNDYREGGLGRVHQLIDVDGGPGAGWVLKVLKADASEELRQRLNAVVSFLEATGLQTEGLSCVPAAVLRDQQDGTLVIAMREAPGSDLGPGYLPRERSLTRQLAAAFQAARSIQRLHAAGAILQDLACDNVILAPRNWALYVIDLDDITFTSTAGLRYQGGGRNSSKGEFCPPEHDSQAPYTEAMDLWSLATLLHFLLTGRLPMDHFDVVLEYTRHGPWTWPPPGNAATPQHLEMLECLGAPLRDALLRVFNEGRVDPGQRPTAAQWAELLDDAQHHVYQCFCEHDNIFVALGQVGVLGACPRCGAQLAPRR